MNYKDFQDSIVDYLSGNLSEEKNKKFEVFLNANKDCQIEFDTIKSIWENSTEETVPSSNMDMNFYSMLKEEEKKTNKTSFLNKLQDFFNAKLIKQLAYTFAILVLGFFIGNSFNSNTNQSIQSLKVAKEETENVRSQLVLTLLEQPSANQRLQAVNEVSKLNKVTETVLKALFTTLNNDENVNVRLSAIEALKKYTHIPLVREGLVSSIAKQESPLIQIALADVMVILQEKKAVESFEKLIEKDNVNSSAKQKMKESIQRII